MQTEVPNETNRRRLFHEGSRGCSVVDTRASISLVISVYCEYLERNASVESVHGKRVFSEGCRGNVAAG